MGAFLELTGALSHRPVTSGYCVVVLDAWADVRNTVAKRRRGHQAAIDALRRKAALLDERCIWQGAIDQETYTRERDRLREESLVTEMEPADDRLLYDKLPP